MSFDTAADVIAALRRKYCRPEWLLFTEVEVGNKERAARVDAMALNLWWSRGLELHGFEIKCSKADFLTEMRDPGKAEAGMTHCDKWWLVVNGKEVAHPEEVPKGWGLMIPRGKELVIKKQAERREDTTPPDMVMMMTFLKKTLRMDLTDEQLAEKYEEGRQLGEKRGEERALERYEYQVERYGVLQANVKDFENVSGIRINNWPGDGARIGRVVDMLRLGNRATRLAERLESIVNVAQNIQEDAEKQLATLVEAEPAVRRIQQEDMFGKAP